MTQRFCTRCAAAIAPDHRFCTACGWSPDFNTPHARIAAPNSPRPPVPPAQPAVAAQAATRSASQSVPPMRKLRCVSCGSEIESGLTCAPCSTLPRTGLPIVGRNSGATPQAARPTKDRSTTIILAIVFVTIIAALVLGSLPKSSSASVNFPNSALNASPQIEAPIAEQPPPAYVPPVVTQPQPPEDPMVFLATCSVCGESYWDYKESAELDMRLFSDSVLGGNCPLSNDRKHRFKRDWVRKSQVPFGAEYIRSK